MNPPDIIVIGAGPAGLACAAEAKRHGLSTLTLDQGSVADAIRRFPNDMTFFSTSELLEIAGFPFLSAGFRPTRVECVRYYQMVAKRLELPVKLQSRVIGLRRVTDGFEVSTAEGTYLGRNLVLATGYFDSPRKFDCPGSDLPKVCRYFTEPFSYSGMDVAVVGGKNSAVETAIELFRAGAKVTLIHRGAALSGGTKYWILPDIENRLKAGEVRGLFETRVTSIKPDSLVVEGGHNEEFPNSVVFVMIGYQPDLMLLKQLSVQIEEESMAPVFDPKTMETNVRGVFVAGSLAAGRNNNKIFIENGRLHGTTIVESILGSR
jgi:thioredoxin reductase (NADPH)